jgi:Zn-dependent peptidase ImmA (M78 family)
MPKFEVSFPPMSGSQIDNLAYEIVKKHQPDVLQGKCAFDIERFVDNNLEDLTGIVPDYRDDIPDEIYGFTDSAGSRMVINANLIDDPYRGVNEKLLRSTLAHETGHCFLHVPILKQSKRDRIFKQEKNEDEVKLYRKTSIPLYRNPEWQAYRFAGALLIPEGVLRNHLDKGERMSSIVDIFGVYPAFVRSRLRGLKIQVKE